MKALPLVAMLLFLAPPEPDSRVEWLAKNATRIRSLDIADGDFRDLAPLRAALAGAQVVMLGEQSHGDGATFLAKARLVRFLHEQMGFNVLAFESGMYDCPKAWDFRSSRALDHGTRFRYAPGK